MVSVPAALTTPSSFSKTEQLQAYNCSIIVIMMTFVKDSVQSTDRIFQV